MALLWEYAEGSAILDQLHRRIDRLEGAPSNDRVAKAYARSRGLEVGKILDERDLYILVHMPVP